MQLKKVTIFLIIALSLASSAASGQDVAYSQFYANPIYLNPALAGNKLVPRITLNYRNQWPAIKKGYVSYSACWDMFVEKINGGVAFQVNTDRMQTMNAFSAAAAYAYQVRISDKLTSDLALQVGYFQYSLNWDKLIFEDQILTGEPTKEVPPEKLSLRSVDFTSGVVFGYNERLYFGAVVSHLNQPDIAFYSANSNRLPLRYTFHVGSLISLRQGVEGGGEKKEFSLSPNIIYLQQGEFHQLNTGLYVTMFPFVVGLWYRYDINNADAVIAMLGLENKTMKIGYSYDLNVPKRSVGTSSRGAHEISFAWLLSPPKKEIRYRAIKSPTF